MVPHKCTTKNVKNAYLICALVTGIMQSHTDLIASLSHALQVP